VIDSFPFDEWAEDITAFWTFGPGNSTGTYVLTVLGLIVFVAAMIGWVWLGEVPTLLSVLGGLLALAGVVLVNRRGREPDR
jgi:drug/metabolite transporter (DMT)-like permease